MNKTETGAAGVKAAYVRPRIVCYATEFESSLCAGTSSDVGHKDAEHDTIPLVPED